MKGEHKSAHLSRKCYTVYRVKMALIKAPAVTRTIIEDPFDAAAAPLQITPRKLMSGISISANGLLIPLIKFLPMNPKPTQ